MTMTSNRVTTTMPTADSASYSIELTDVSKRFTRKKAEVIALDEVDLSVRPGEFLSLVGPSGCGKSTLLRIVAGLIPASDGTVGLGQQEVTAPRDDVGIVFQAPVLLPWRTVLDNVLLPAQVSGGRKERRALRAKAEDLLAMAGLGDFLDAHPGQLSGGMQQRVSICRALVRNPRVLLMDEPFGALDAITREQMADELLRIWSEVGTTVLFITHSIPEAVYLSDRVAVMSSRPGRITEVYDVEIPRPRDSSTYAHPTFAWLTTELRDAIERDHV